MATCWWIDTLPASAIFMMLLANSSSGGRQQGSELGRMWALPGAWGRAEGALTKAGSLLCPGQQLLGIAAPGLGILQSCIHTARGPNEPQVQLLPWSRRLDF